MEDPPQVGIRTVSFNLPTHETFRSELNSHPQQAQTVSNNKNTKHAEEFDDRSVLAMFCNLVPAPLKKHHKYNGFWSIKIKNPWKRASGIGLCLRLIDIIMIRSQNVPDVYDAQYEIRLSLYDVVYRRFVGETWKSKSIRPSDDESQSSELHCMKTVYFHTEISDPNVILVLEIAVTRSPRNPLSGEEIISTKRTLGWGVIRPFKSEQQVTDTSAQDSSVVKRMDVYHGTPRALLFMGDSIETNENIQLVPGCQLTYQLQTHKALEPIMHLMPENVFFASEHCLPGMAQASSKPGQVPDHYAKAVPLPSHTCYLDNLSLNYGVTNVDKFEALLCSRINRDRLLKDKAEDDGKTVVITERRLMVGVHNGYCYIQKPQFSQLEPEAVLGSRQGSFGRGKRKDTSTTASSSPSTCLVLRSRVQLDEMVDDPGLAIVMQIEYQLALPHTSQTNMKALGSASSLRSQPVSVSVRWTAWCPFQHELNQSSIITLSLLGGMEKNPDNLLFYAPHMVDDTSDWGKIRFRLLTSDTQSITDVSMNGISASDGTHLSAAMATKPPLPYSPQPQSYLKASRIHDPASEYESKMRMPSNVMNVEITHLEMEGDMPPVHAPPILPVAQRTPGMTRAAYARMYAAGFPDIVDHMGNPTEVVNANDNLDNVDITTDVIDPLQTNEIIVQFLAFMKPSPGPGEASPPLLNSIFCSFQFYRFQPVTTSRMSLTHQSEKADDIGVKRSATSLPHILRKIEAGEHLDKGRPGLEVKYYVDPANMNPGENSSFLQYLRTHTLHIDVWDGDSLMLVGSLSVPLKHLLRQGRPAVAVNHEIDVVFAEHTDNIPTITGEMKTGGTVRPLGLTKTYRGKLHLRLANVGYVTENKSAINIDLLQGTKKHLVTADISGTAFSGGSISTAKSFSGQPAYNKAKKCQAKKLTEINSELSELLLLNTNEEDHPLGDSVKIVTDKSIESDRKRKLARMLAIREAEKQGSDNQASNIERVGQRALVNKQERTLKLRDLRTVETYRSRLKPNHITELLTLSITTQHTIRPSLGSAHFVELLVKNPFNIQHTVTIDCDCPELRVVTDSREWRFFKSICGLHTPAEENMFNFDPVTSLPQVFLRPKETVYVPFRYQAFKVDSDTLLGPSQFFKPTTTALQPVKKQQKSNGTIKAKVARAFLRTSDSKPLSVLQLNVEPQPHIVDQTFRFYNPENSFLKKCIRLPPFKMTDSENKYASSHFHVECSDPEVICQARSASPNEPQEIFIKAPCSTSPSVRRFFLALYNDSFIASPIQIWQFYVHALQRVDVSCVLGQTTRLALVLKGTQTGRMVKCFSSHPLQMEVAPSDSFMLSANTVRELTVGVRTLGTAGTKYMYINVVDMEYHQLIRSWLIAVNSKQPIVTKEFDIEIPMSGGKGCFKKITYTNPYPSRKNFQLLTSRPDLLHFKDSHFQLGPGETFTIGLQFASGVRSPGKHNVHIFIDDEESKNEETFAVIVMYV